MTKLASELTESHDQLLSVDSLEEARKLQRAASSLMDVTAQLRNALGFRILDLKKPHNVSTETCPAFAPTIEENRKVVGAIVGTEKAAALTDGQIGKVVSAIVRDGEMREIFEALQKMPTEDLCTKN
jgi:hypothetical protein